MTYTARRLDPAALEEWNAAVRRARADYRAQPNRACAMWDCHNLTFGARFCAGHRSGWSRHQAKEAATQGPGSTSGPQHAGTEAAAPLPRLRRADHRETLPTMRDRARQLRPVNRRQHAAAVGSARVDLGC